MSFKHLIIFFSVLTLSSCVKDKPEPVPSKQTILTTAKKVYVVNEGNFNSSNAGVSIYDTGNNAVIEDIYKEKNNVALGDVAQSMTKINGEYYIVVNNSNKIVVCGDDFIIKRTITGLTSPRYIIAVSNQKAYVSDIYANGLHIVDLNTGTKTGSITLKGDTEQMVMLFGKVYVTNASKDKIYVIDAVNNIITDSIVVGMNASSLVLDKNDKLWVLSSGSSSVTGKLSLIDPANNSITWSQNFGSTTERPGFLCINGTKDTLFYANNTGVCKMPISSTSLPSAFITSTSNIYGLSVHPTRFEVYVADARDFVSRSKIFIYKSSNGEPVHDFLSGFLSNSFYFD